MNTLNPNPQYKFYAGFSKRFFAWIIDSLILFSFLTTIRCILNYPTIFTVLHECYASGIRFTIQNGTSDSFPAFPAYSSLNPQYYLIIAFVSWIITWLYFALFESSSKQGTIGKMALRIRVTNLSGERISFWRATGRYWAKYISCFTLGIGYIITIFTEKKQALHDIIADCLVLQYTPEQQLFDKKLEMENTL